MNSKLSQSLYRTQSVNLSDQVHKAATLIASKSASNRINPEDMAQEIHLRILEGKLKNLPSDPSEQTFAACVNQAKHVRRKLISAGRRIGLPSRQQPTLVTSIMHRDLIATAIDLLEKMSGLHRDLLRLEIERAARGGRRVYLPGIPLTTQRAYISIARRKLRDALLRD
jgi:hypothetical protein